MNASKRFVLGSQDNAIIALLILIGAIASAKDVLHLLLPGDAGLYIVVSIFFVIAARQVLYEKRLGALAPMPPHPIIFNPFKVSADGREFRAWNREEEAKEIVARVEQSDHSHLIICGTSGAGKSTLISEFVAPSLTKNYSVHQYVHYSGILMQVLTEFTGDPIFMDDQTRILERYSSIVPNSTCLVKEVFEPGFSRNNPQLGELWRDIERHLNKAFDAHRPQCFIFDQVERYIHVMAVDVERLGTELNGYEVFLFMNFVRFCRMNAKCRTVFVIRAEYLYESIDFLETITPVDTTKTKRISFFLCPGINAATSRDAVKQIRRNFILINGVRNLLPQFEKICGLDSRTYSNTFLTQLVGFVIEHFYKTDPNVRIMLQDRKNRALALFYYFNHLLNDFARAFPSRDALETLKTVLFTIATENRITGRSITLSRVAALSHMPEDVIADAIDFAKNAGILVDDENDKMPSYFIIHDIMIDYILENEQLAIHPTLKDSIRGLSENRVASEKLTRLKSYANLLIDLWMQPNPGVIAIWMFFIFGALQTEVEPACNWSHHVLVHIAQSRDCAFVMKFYLPIYLMHVAWLTFIYYIDREYLRYTLHSRALKTVSALMPVFGAVLAVVFSQSPTLFVIPVISIGLVMGLLLILGVVDGSYVGRNAEENFGWGVLTIVNMIIASSLTLVTWLVLWDDVRAEQFWEHVGLLVSPTQTIQIDGDIISILWMYVVNFFMIYFWLHIRKKQQWRISFAARLALYDRTHREIYEK